MKARSYIVIIAASASVLWAGGSPAQTTPQTVTATTTAATASAAPVLWSVHFDAERLRTGVGKELFANLDPILTALSGEKSSVPGGKLEFLAMTGFQPRKKSGDKFPFLADLRFSPDNGGISRRFEAVSKKRGVPIEPIAGSASMHFEHQGKEVWIAKFTDSRLFVATSRALLEPALSAASAGGITTAPPPADELLGGKVEIGDLLSDHPDLHDSELLKLLPHLDFHVASAGEKLDVDASAELDSDRSARRAARMIDGMVAALALHDTSGVPWDDRLTLKQDGAKLAIQLHLEPQEAKKLFDSFAREIQNHGKHSTHDEE